MDTKELGPVRGSLLFGVLFLSFTFVGGFEVSLSVPPSGSIGTPFVVEWTVSEAPFNGTIDLRREGMNETLQRRFLYSTELTGSVSFTIPFNTGRNEELEGEYSLDFYLDTNGDSLDTRGIDITYNGPQFSVQSPEVRVPIVSPFYVHWTAQQVHSPSDEIVVTDLDGTRVAERRLESNSTSGSLLFTVHKRGNYVAHYLRFDDPDGAWVATTDIFEIYERVSDDSSTAVIAISVSVTVAFLLIVSSCCGVFWYCKMKEDTPTTFIHHPQTKSTKKDESEMDNMESGKGECKVCFDRAAKAVLNPCGHANLCLKCARSFKDCPFCRKKIVSVIEMYKD